ncbi:MAG TPA: efflux RND transporter permease subunit [Bacteroides sp.]|nr:efflux RND transporter permease subunit [Bacteroides sp.]
MLGKIIQYSLNNRLLILFLAVAILILGTYVGRRMKVDVFPDLTAPTVVVLTDAHGFATEEVERMVTFPIESALYGATDVRRVRSSSSAGFSIVWVEFNWGTDIYVARQIVSEKLGMLTNQMPEGVSSPFLAPQTSIMGEIMLVAISSDSLSKMELRNIADWQVRQRLLSVTGVSQIIVMGGDPKEYQVFADPLKMKYFDVSLDELTQATRSLNINVSGGFINEFGQEYFVRAVGRSLNPDEIGNSVIKMREEKPVLISDVARVIIGTPQKIGAAFMNDKEAVILTVLKQPNTNTLELTSFIDEALGGLENTLPVSVQLDSHFFRQADFISTAVNNVMKVLIEGGIFVTLVLFLFLFNFRTTVISLLAIPISLITAMVVLHLLGYSINTMSLGGMAIAVGALVDDAIIDVENVLKRLKQNHLKPAEEKENTLKVIYTASMEIRSSIVQATLIIIVAFIPLFFLSGMEGRMLRPLGITFIVSLFASLLVALTVTPVLSSYLLVRPRQLRRNIRGGNPLIQKLNSVYQRSLGPVLRNPRIVIVSAGLLLIMSILLMTGFGRSFLPDFNEGTLTITTVGMPGISLEESNRISSRVDRELLMIPEVQNVSRRTGRAELNEHSHGGSNSSEIDVPFILEDRSREEFLADVRQRLGMLSGLSINIGQPLSHRIDHLLSGTRANIAIKIFGVEQEALFSIAGEVQAIISEIPGVVDINREQLGEIPQIQIRPRRELLQKYGIPINKFTEFVETAIGGLKVSEVYENNMNYDLVLRYDEPYRNSVQAIENILIDTWEGVKIPLMYVADVVSVSGPNIINRENVQRKMVVSANVAGRDLGSVVKDVRKELDANIDLPENYRIEFGGQFESAQQAQRLLLFSSLLAILVIFVILYQEFKNTTVASIILLNLPLALIGGVISIWLTSRIISIPSIIGFITLFGIATRNGILLVSRYRHMQEEGISLLKAVVDGSTDRLNPILMTAMASALALLPMAIAGSKPGNEIQAPMAVVILGGLITSTMLNLYVIPTVYYLIFKEKKNEND